MMSMAPPFKKTLKVTSILLVFMALVLAVAMGYIRWRHQTIWNGERAAMAAAGYPTSWEEVEALYPPVPEDENGAVHIVRALEELVDTPYDLHARLPIAGAAGTPKLPDPFAIRDFKIASLPTAFSESDIAAMRECRALDEALLNALYAGALRPAVRFDFDSMRSDVHFYGRLRHAGARCVVALALATIDRDGDEAVRAALAGFGVARAFESIPMHIPNLAGRQFLRTLLTELERALYVQFLAADQLGALAPIVKELPDYTALAPGLKVQPFVIMQSADASDVSRRLGERAGRELVKAHAPGPLQSPLVRVVPPMSGWLYSVLKMGHRSVAARAPYGRTYYEIFEEGEPWQFESKLKDRTTRPGRILHWPYYFSHVGLSAREFDPRNYVEDDRRMDLLYARILIEQFRATHGDWPESLDALVPTFAKSVPKVADFETPIVYYPEGDHFRLY